MSSNLGKRLLVAAWGVPLLLLLTWLGGWAFTLAVSLLATLTVLEVGQLLRRRELNIGRYIVPGIAILLPVLAHLYGLTSLVLAFWGALLLIGFTSLSYDNHEGAGRFAAGVFVVGFVVMPLTTLVLLREAAVWPDKLTGTAVVVYVIGGVWITDTAAYAAGRLIGRHPLAPRISPNKTIEGGVGALLGAVLFSLLWVELFTVEIAWPHRVAMGVILAVAATVGDLVQSMIKRSVSVKDSGNLLPGHGGVFDRFDSLLFVAPAMLLYLVAVGFVQLG
jgi:phosphatidate cytidylyltransferase